MQLQRKLTFVILAACMTVLLIFAIPFLIFQWVNYEDTNEENLIKVAEHVSHGSTIIRIPSATVETKEILASFESQDQVTFAGIFKDSPEGQTMFESYQKAGHRPTYEAWKTLRPGNRIRINDRFIYATAVRSLEEETEPTHMLVVSGNPSSANLKYEMRFSISDLEEVLDDRNTLQQKLDQHTATSGASFMGIARLGEDKFWAASPKGKMIANEVWMNLNPPQDKLIDDEIIYAEALHRKSTEAEQSSMDSEILGTLFIEAQLEPFWKSFLETALFILLMLLTASLIAYILANAFQRIFTRPIYELAETAGRVSRRRDYSLRVEKRSDDELGNLINVFNQMLSEIQQRDEDLSEASDKLEDQVKELQHEIKQRQLGKMRESDLHEKLDRAKRMESLGILAGGVAHDLNNILGPLVGYPEMILEDLEPDSPLRPDIEEIQSSASRAAAVIQDLLTLSRRGNYQMESIDLANITTRFLHSDGCQNTLEKHPAVRMITEISEASCTAHGSAAHIDKVIMNLFANACESMPNGGDLKIKVETVELTSAINRFETIPIGKYRAVEIRDQGVGISAEKMERIFEPFFSIKPMGDSGSGLGLAVVYGVIKDLNGYIDVESAPDVGSTFRILLPAVDEALLVTEKDRLTDLTGHEHILVVDDLREQGRMASAMLTRLGYQVSIAKTGRKAIEHVGAGNPVDLVILDMVIEPDFDGLDTLKGLRKLSPNLPAIVCTGFSQNERIDGIKELGVNVVVRKPYSAKKLGRAIREELDLHESTPRPSLPNV